jgi:hypothetical protein
MLGTMWTLLKKNLQQLKTTPILLVLALIVPLIGFIAINTE